VTALELWPEEGIPENPGAWLMTAAKRRAIDSLRRGQMLLQKHEAIARELVADRSTSWHGKRRPSRRRPIACS
jgi:predicted RNA polymerase sigma factor